MGCDGLLVITAVPNSYVPVSNELSRTNMTMKAHLLIAGGAICLISLGFIVINERFGWYLRFVPVVLVIGAVSLNVYTLTSKKCRTNPRAQRSRRLGLITLALSFLLLYVGSNTAQALSKQGCFLVLDLPLLPRIQLPHPYDHYVFHNALMFLIIASLTSAVVFSSSCLFGERATKSNSLLG